MRTLSLLTLTILTLTAVILTPASALATGCGGDPCLLVYAGKLTQDTTTSPQDTWVKEVELGDVNGDGMLDLLMLQKLPGLGIGDSAPNKDVLYLGTGDPGFSFQLGDSLDAAFTLQPGAVPASVMANRGYDAEFADLDLDGNLDVIRVDIPGRIDVLMGQGDGTFTHHDAAVALGGDPNGTCPLFGNAGSPTGGTYDDVDVADLDHDGDWDFVIGQYADCGKNLVIQNGVLQGPGGPPGFPPPLAVAANFPAKLTHAVSIGDADGDCKLDVLLGNTHRAGKDPARPELYLGQAVEQIQFSRAPAVKFDEIATTSPTAVGDIVGDLGLACTSATGQPIDDGIPDNLPDLTGDGAADVFLAQNSEFVSADFGLYVNNGMAVPYAGITGCTGTTCAAVQGRYDVRYGDLDQDGAMEAIFVEQNFRETAMTGCVWQTSLEIVRFDPSGFRGVTPELIDVSALAGINAGGIAVALGDLDLDGDLDVVLGGVRENDGGMVLLEPPSTAECNATTNTQIYGAAHVYENRIFTRVGDRTITSAGSLYARDRMTATGGLRIEGGADVVFESQGEIVLEGEVTISPSSGSFVARIL